MAVDSGYFASLDLEPLLIDKDTGQPLSNGTIRFFQDTNRNVPKLVYQLVNLGGNPPNYDFQPLPNPINLGAFGTIQDNAANNVALYYYPYDDAGAVQLYYVEVRNANGVLQFTREAWPPNVNEADNPNNAIGNIANQLSNPQFAQVSFLPNNPLTITIAIATTTTVSIAPDWDIVIVTSGASTVAVLRTSIAGTQAFPFNPPYTLTITPGANITSIKLRQRLNNNPNIWAPAIPNALNGYLASTILLAPASSVIMEYQPSGQAVQVLLTANNISGAFAQFNNTVQLLPDNNPQNSDVGFVDILLNLPVGAPTTFSNVQVVPLNTNQINIVYDQTPVNRQADQLFNYWQSLLNFKPVSSFLIGWDFPLNPAQFLGTAVAASAAGNNTSRYVWDQLIIFQSANNGYTVQKPADGTLTITSSPAAGTQLALVQYLEASTSNDILSAALQGLASNINIATTQIAGISCSVDLYYTTGTLPNINANNSIVATLNADGTVATFNNGTQPWIKVPRSNLGNATFTVNNTVRANTGFSGWVDTTGGSATATYFAIVIGFGNLAQNNLVTINSISLVPGSIPTIPAPQAVSEVLRECQRYYQKSFETATIPAQNIGFNTGEQSFTSSVGNNTGTASGSIMFQNAMIDIPTIVTYNPRAASNQVTDFEAGNCTATNQRNISTKQFNLTFTSNGATVPGNTFCVHWTADSRLGTP